MSGDGEVAARTGLLTATTLPNPARAMCDGRHKIGASGICYKAVTPKRFPRYFRKLLISELGVAE